MKGTVARAAPSPSSSCRPDGRPLPFHRMSRAQESRDRERLAAEVHLGPRPAKGSDLSVCLAYANTYPVGMANLGFQAIYGILVRAGVQAGGSRK